MRLTTPVAVLLGIASSGAFIAIALYFALRPPPPSRSPSPDESAENPPLVPLPPPAPVAAPPPPAPDATAEATQALAAERARLAKACWPDGGAPAAGSLGYIVHLAFDAKGHQSAKALITARNVGLPAVVECIARELRPVTIAPDHAPAVVDAPFALP